MTLANRKRVVDFFVETAKRVYAKALRDTAASQFASAVEELKATPFDQHGEWAARIRALKFHVFCLVSAQPFPL